MPETPQHLMDGKTIRYTYSGGLAFEVSFENGLASYKALVDSGNVSNENSNIPYQSREIRAGLIHVIWHEEDIKDLVSLVIDLDNNKIFSAALLGYGTEDGMLHFEDGVIEG